METAGWRVKWEKLPQTPQSYNPKEEYIKHLEEKYEKVAVARALIGMLPPEVDIDTARAERLSK